MEEIQQYAKENVLLFLVGNKSDLEDQRVVETKEAQDFANTYNIPFVETSAKGSINISDMFIDATRSFIKKQETAHKNYNTNSNKNKNQLQDEKKITTLVSKKKNSMLINVGEGNKSNNECCK